MTTLLGVVGSPSRPSRTRAAVEAALGAAGEETGVETEVLHTGELDIVEADGRALDDYEGDTRAALEQVVEADAYVVGTPVYRASYSGALKNLLDMVPRGIWQADVTPLEGAAVGLVATGASPHHYLTVDEELRPVLAFFGAHVVGSGVYAHDDHFQEGADGYAVADEDVRSRLETLGRSAVDLTRAVEKSDALSSLGPQI